MSEQDTNDAPLSEEDQLVAALTEDNNTPPEAEEPEEFEVEVGPAKYKVPKPIKEAWDGMQRHHTERSEKTASEERSLKEQRTKVEEQAKIVQSFPKELAKVVKIQDELEAYDKVDWAALRMSGETVKLTDGREVASADYHRGQYENLRAQLDKASGELTGKIQLEQGKRDASLAEQKANYHREMGAKIKDWSPEKDKEIRDFAVKNGVPKDLADSIYHPGIMQIASMAITYVKAMEKAKAAAANKDKTGEEPLAPPAKVKATAGPKGDVRFAKSAEEHQKIRMKEMAQARAEKYGTVRRH